MGGDPEAQQYANDISAAIAAAGIRASWIKGGNISALGPGLTITGRDPAAVEAVSTTFRLVGVPIQRAAPDLLPFGADVVIFIGPRLPPELPPNRTD